MIASIPRRYTRAALSNSNSLHWSRVMNEMQLGPAFDHHFSSHLIGKIKPDAEAFHHVLDSLGCNAHEVLFLDDNLLNVDAARALGMHAVVVRGATEARLALEQAGVIAGA
jgi:putative hydrolase of the HAD superfamily